MINDNSLITQTYFKKNNDLEKEITRKYNNKNDKFIIKNTPLECKIDENDMKPKIMFINLKKDLLEQTLKINRMFSLFNKQIKENEKSIRFICRNNKNLTLNNNLMQNNMDFL